MVYRTGNILLWAVLLALTCAPGASAWAWPVDGPVLRPFVAEGDPYSGGQHRGIDIGAPTGSDVRSAATGVASYVGRLPHQGLCLTVRTADGYSVTLVHLGSIGVTTGTPVSEGDVVGTIGPSGDVEGTEPYVYLGIRLTADPNGYLDPLGLLPARHAPEQPPVSQPQGPAVQPAPPPVRAKAPRSAPPRVRRSPGPRGSTGRSARAAAPKVRVQHSRPRSRRGRPPVPRTKVAPPVRALRATMRSPEQPAEDGGVLQAWGHAPRAEAGDEPPAQAAGRRVRVVVRAHGHGSRRVLLVALALAALSLLALGVTRAARPRPAFPGRVPPRPLRKMSMTLPVPEESLPEPPTTAHLPSRRLALRGWPATSRTCRRLRGSIRHHGPVSPAARRLGADGQRNRRARNAGHGRRRSRGAVSA
jgi:hypothetical protein